MEFTDGDDLEFTEYTSKVVIRLDNEIERVRGICFSIAANNDERRMCKTESLTKMHAAFYDNNFEFISHFNRTTNICYEQIRGSIDSTAKRSKTCVEAFAEWRSEVSTEMGQAMDRDEFTMMPYDDVHSQTDQLKEASAKFLLEMDEAINKNDIKKGTLKDQKKQLQLEMDELKIYVGEIRNEKHSYN